MARDDDQPPAKRPRKDCTGTSSIDGDPPPAKRPRTNSTGTRSINSFPEDLLHEIFLRVDSLSDLVRAACTCREWRGAVVSSPPFRREFIERHPAPLLGLFFDPPSPDVPAIPAFAPARGEDPMLVAALLRGDFLLTNLQKDGRAVEPSWFVLDARGGYLLLMNWDDGMLALLNPLARPHQRFFDLDDIPFFDDNHIGDRRIFHAGVIIDDENPERFAIFCLAVQGGFRLRAAIFSSVLELGGGWIFSAWLEVPEHPDPEIHGGLWLESGMRVGNLICWPYKNREYLVVLDPTIPQLFVEMIPAGLNQLGFRGYIIGETHGGTMSIACTDGLNIFLMVRGEDALDAEAWVTFKEFYLTEEIVAMLGPEDDFDGLELVAMRGSIVYFTTLHVYHLSETPCWFVSLCLETGKVERLFARTYDGFFQPYHHLSWTSFLLPGRQDQ